jgi:hypothetical protein
MDQKISIIVAILKGKPYFQIQSYKYKREKH